MIKTLMAVAVAGVFALPVTASAGNDNLLIAQAGGGSGGGADAPDMANRQPGTMTQPGTMESDKNAGASQRSARSSTGSTAERFDRLDRNGDGFISRDEAKDAPELQTRFSELDTNNDGKLSREEYGALDRSASGATGSTTARGAEPRQPGKSPAPGKGGGDSSSSGSNTK